MKANQDDINDPFENGLRIKAEKMLTDIGQRKLMTSDQDIQALFQELQVHQIELEMQNDELKTANEGLELQQIKFSSIYNLAPLGYFILNNYGVIEEVNNAGAFLIEGGKAGLLGKRMMQFVSHEYSETFYRFFKDMQGSQAKQSCQLKMISRANTEFYAQVEGTAISPLTGGGAEYYIAIIDITERIEAVKTLAETKERLELSLEASSAGAWELDLDNMHFYLDEFNYHMCAIPEGGFDGRYHTFLDLIHPDDRQLVDEQFRKSINHEKEIDVVCRLMNEKGGGCYASIRGHMISEPGQTKRLVGIMIDISEKRRIEEETVALKRDQQRIITLATLNAEENERRRISDALHDSVSQLLYGIKMKLSALNLGRTKASIDIGELIDQAIRETRNISFELAPSILLDFGLPATVDELVKRLSSPNMRIHAKVTGFETRDDMLLETTIFRIIQELINNCMKHANASLIRLDVKKNQHIEIRIQDNGEGFNYQEQENSASGSGLRSIKNRISLYNGELTVDSEQGKGTTIKIVLDHKPKS
ncbi:PAS domain S-box protein [Inquilinus sp. KBS0705]|nr:PAS domain S-box protein [Inquilinus sp. KBS0705]